VKSAIIVHGGAGAWKLREGNLPQAIAACEEAARRGQQVLLEGGQAVDAVEVAVRVLEDAPVLDAGRGSYLNAAGEIEMDAIIMNGATLDLGAVGAVQRVQHPISLARQVLDACEHNFLVGRGAEAFADQIGFPRCAVADLLVGKERDAYLALQQDPDYDTSVIFTDEGAMGTVGAVALDSSRNVAAATSTGGTRKKLPGRIGDSPLVGSGAYADNQTGAASATGYGEALMKIIISKQVCDALGSGLSASAACKAAIQLLEQRVKGHGGVIAVSAQGGVGFAFNTDAMPYAYAAGRDPVLSGS
jgi:beta-aspartyl-peptidase (threonine type)